MTWFAAAMHSITSMGPFLGTEAIAAGLATRRTLNSRYRRIFRNVYAAPELLLTPLVLAEAAWLFAGRNATLAGISAAALHGDKWLIPSRLSGDTRPRTPPELMRTDAGCRGLRVHRRDPAPDEIMTVDGMSVTTPARTAFDLGRRQGRLTALIRCDALANATGLTPEAIQPLIARYPGRRGLVQLRELVSIMDGGAESPQETRTRLVLLDAGLRRPQTQIAVCDAAGYQFARIDLGYEEFKVGVEYDGIQHWTDPRQRARDIERRRELAEQEWAMVHVTSTMLDVRPQLVVRRVADALREAGCPWVDEGRLMSRESVKRVS